MKKTLLALAVFAAAGSAQAIEVYNQDGVTVNLQGDFEFRYVKTTTEDSNLAMEVNDADLGFDVRYAVNDNLSVGGYVQYQGDSGNVISKNTNNGNAYVGFYTADFGSLKFGKLDIQLDDMGVGSDDIFGIDSYISDLEANGNEAVRYDLDKGAYYIGASLIQNHQGANGALPKDHNWDVRGGVRVADFDFTGYYGESGDASLVGTEARFAGIENVNLELGYYLADGVADDVNAIAFAADYSMNAWGFGVGVGSKDFDKDTQEDYVDWFANVNYKLATNTKIYTEIGGNDKEDSELGYGFGIEASF